MGGAVLSIIFLTTGKKTENFSEFMFIPGKFLIR